ncbi:hypothetical protein O23A_P3p0019 (plasmid) [Aeromonas salmonicida]|nr:hypothetical protein O23A_P3p0019 [Aeromonas salmonicida]
MARQYLLKKALPLGKREELKITSPVGLVAVFFIDMDTMLPDMNEILLGFKKPS